MKCTPTVWGGRPVLPPPKYSPDLWGGGPVPPPPKYPPAVWGGRERCQSFLLRSPRRRAGGPPRGCEEEGGVQSLFLRSTCGRRWWSRRTWGVESLSLHPQWEWQDKQPQVMSTTAQQQKSRICRVVHTYRQESLWLSVDVETVPRWYVFFQLCLRNTSSRFLSHSNDANGWQCRFRSSETTDSSIASPCHGLRHYVAVLSTTCGRSFCGGRSGLGASHMCTCE